MIEFPVKLLVMVQLLALMMAFFGQSRALWLQFAGWFMVSLLLTALWSLWVGAWALLLPYGAALAAVIQLCLAWWRQRPEGHTWKVQMRERQANERAELKQRARCP